MKLQTLLATAQSNVAAVAAALAPWKVAVNNRETAFDGIRKLVTRIVANLAASGAPPNVIEDAKSIKRNIDGARKKALPPDDPATPVDESAGISVSQQSYSQLVDHFDNLIQLLTNTATYIPNETALKVVTLNTLSASLKTANNAVVAANTPLSNARIARNTTMYLEPKNMIDRALLVKKYVKSVFGADSPQYQQVSGLEFRRPRL
ncbi:MAG: hypothetical protein ACKVRN_08290 [Pyrinomonadaceae bacterium]